MLLTHKYNRVPVEENQENLPLFLPESFQPEAILPGHLAKYSDHCRWLIHLLFARRIFDKRQKDSFINLKAAYLRKVLPFRHYRTLINCLIQSGILESDNQYIMGEKCIGYRLTESFREATHIKHFITNKNLAKKLTTLKRQQESKGQVPILRHLHLYLQEIRFDLPNALKIISEMPDDKRKCALHACDALQNRCLYFKNCQYGRVHTNLTSLDSKLRPFLRFRGKSLYELDIANSQPLIFGILLLNLIQNEGKLEGLHQYAINEENHLNLVLNTIKEEKETNPPTTILPLRCDFRNISLSPDIKLYLELVQEGKLYEYLAPEEERKSFKAKFFQRIFFDQNKNIYPETRAFEKAFPNVLAIIREIKRRDYTQLSKLLQRIESDIVIHRICWRLMENSPHIPIWTIHDSIISTEPEIINQVIREEFFKVGLSPTIRKKALYLSQETF